MYEDREGSIDVYGYREGGSGYISALEALGLCLRKEKIVYVSSEPVSPGQLVSSVHMPVRLVVMAVSLVDFAALLVVERTKLDDQHALFALIPAVAAFGLSSDTSAPLAYSLAPQILQPHQVKVYALLVASLSDNRLHFQTFSL